MSRRPARKPGLLFEAERPSAAPPADHLVARVDGGARGNPGPAAYGVVIEDASGRKLAELSEYLGHQTNNHAEYRGLIAALDYARAHGHSALRVLADSELLVRQMRGQYKVKSPELRPLFERARGLAAQLDWFAIEHVPREQNRAADRLANDAMDKGSGKPKSQEVGGVVRDGVVVLENTLPEGTRVRVRALK
ncbi:MAG TPA: ribonuclease HI family protein [Terriglobales bacterium]|nr:ribonuclease HI family protein [Terriglobales bacterium]